MIGQDELLAVLVLIVKVLVEPIVGATQGNGLTAIFETAALVVVEIGTLLSSAKVVSPVVMPDVLPVLVLVTGGVVGGVVVGGVGVVGGGPHDTELVLVVHPFVKLLKLSSPLLTQPLKAKVIIIKANPALLRIKLSRNLTDAQIAAIPLILR